MIDSGLVGSDWQVANVTQSVLSTGPGRGQTVIRVDVDAGVSLEILADRGLDIAGAWYRGRSLAWRSPTGIRGPSPVQRLDSWLDEFVGGLVSTCGLENVGAPSDGQRLHGSYSLQPASEVVVRREGDFVEVAGHVDDLTTLGGRHLRVQRTIRTSVGAGRLELTDAITNLGTTTEPAQILYHMNFGWPVWAPGSRFLSTSRWVEPVAGFDGDVIDWRIAPVPEPGAVQSVFDHIPYPGERLSARIESPTARLVVAIDWDNASLPRFTQWVHPGSGIYALGVEPANSSVLGRAHDREEGRLVELAPGGSFATSVVLTVAPLVDTHGVAE